MTPSTYAPALRGMRPKRRSGFPPSPSIVVDPSTVARTCERLIEVLDEEMQAILTHDSETLAKLHQSKRDLVRTLEGAGADLTAAALDPELRDLLAACRERNQRNGGLLQIRQRHADRTLQILHGSDQHAGVYDGTGTQRSSLRPRYHASA